MALAKRLGLARTEFYWHFRDRDAPPEAMIRRWQDKNTGNLVDRAAAYADTICEAMFKGTSAVLNSCCKTPRTRLIRCNHPP